MTLDKTCCRTAYLLESVTLGDTCVPEYSQQLQCHRFSLTFPSIDICVKSRARGSIDNVAFNVRKKEFLGEFVVFDT